MSEKLTCTYLVRINDGRDQQNKILFHHVRCAAPASEVSISGMLTSAKSVLCPKHAAIAERDAFVSERGWEKGKVKDDKVVQAKIKPLF